MVLFMNDPKPKRGDNRNGAVAGLAIAVVLLVVGVWLAHELTAASRMPLTSPRRNTFRPAR